MIRNRTNDEQQSDESKQRNRVKSSSVRRSVSVHPSDPSEVSLNRKTTNYRTASFTTAVEYTNYCSKVVYLKTQANIPFAIERNSVSVPDSEIRPHLEVIHTYTIHTPNSISGSYDILAALLTKESITSDETYSILDAFSKFYSNNRLRSGKTDFRFSIVRRYLEESINAQPSLYIRESDIVLTFDRSELEVPHPNSRIGVQHFEILKDKSHEGYAGVLVRVIDNANVAKVRYYYAGKQLITVPSYEDQTFPSGVYITVLNGARDGYVDTTTEFITFEEAEEKIGLYRSRDEAVSNGNPEYSLKAEEARAKAEEARYNAENRKLKQEAAIHEERLRTLTLQTEMYKAENAQLKESLDIRNSLRKDQFEEKEHRRKNRNRERDDYYDHKKQQRDDFYSSRSHHRKDISEMIKYIPALLLGAFSAYAIISAKTKQ